MRKNTQPFVINLNIWKQPWLTIETKFFFIKYFYRQFSSYVYSDHWDTVRGSITVCSVKLISSSCSNNAASISSFRVHLSAAGQFCVSIVRFIKLSMNVIEVQRRLTFAAIHFAIICAGKWIVGYQLCSARLWTIAHGKCIRWVLTVDEKTYICMAYPFFFVRYLNFWLSFSFPLVFFFSFCARSAVSITRFSRRLRWCFSS